jgi:ligand-binding sensor domain-containing protein/signal transduction histidine kinase
MIRARWRGHSVWVLLLAFTTSALALDPRRSLDHYGHQAWRTDSGLPQNTVHSILQTRDGFVWLGTDGGLVRFDGIDFITFDAENTPQLKSDTVSDLLEDHSGKLWISSTAGLVSYREGVFTAYTAAQGLPADTVWFSYEDHRQRLWAITPAGPAWFDGKAFTPLAGAQAAAPLHRQALAEDARGTLWLGGSSGVFALDSTASPPRLALHLLSGVPVEAVELDRQGNVWMGTGEGLERYAGGALVPVPAPAGKRQVTALHDDGQGGTWVGTASGMMHLTAGGAWLPLATNGLAMDRVNQLFEDRQRVLWISTERGVFRFAGNLLQSFAPDSALAVNRVLAMLEDREGNLWVGTDSAGLHLLRDQKFTTYTTSDGLSGNFVRCVFQSGNGALWIGTDGAGLNRRTSSGFAHYSTAQGLSSNVILSLADGGHGDLWIGTPNGLNLLHPSGKVERFSSADGLPDDFIRSLANDRDGSLWIGTRHGLAHLTGGKFSSFSSMDGLASDFIGTILRDGQGPLSSSDPLWIGTSAGLSRLEGGAFTNSTSQQGLSNNTVTAIAQDHTGTLWLGTNGGGLNRVGPGKTAIQTYPSRAQGLPNTIYGMLEDASGHLWISSKTGIFRVSLAQLNAPFDARAGVLAVNAYGTADGMNIRECSGGGHPAAWKLADGSLWFATLDGVSSVEPGHLPENRVPPPVSLEKILVDDQPRSLPGSLDQQLTVKPGANRLEVQYAGLSFVAPERVQYRYQLEGFDHGWIDAGTRRAAFYTNLPPGSYRFRVLAANNDGVWNLTGASFGLRMMPHFYQTWWFYSALALALLLTGYLVYRWRVVAVEAEWGAVLRERGRIAREIHDTLAQGFVGISVQLELVARLLSGWREGAAKRAREPVPGSELEPVFIQLDQARALVRASLADARTSIWDLRSEAGGGPGLSAGLADDLPARLSRSCTRIAGGSPAKVYLQVKGTYRPLERRIEDELLRIGEESVANAVRHAAAARIDVQLIYQAGRVSLRVEDDGRGFDPSSNGAQGHYGIQGMQERAGEIAATLELESAPGEGTRISVDAPV